MRWPRLRLLEPWRSRVLWISLGLNVFAAATAAVPMLRPRHAAVPVFDMVIERMARDLPAGDAAVFRDAMAKERPWFEAGRQRLTEGREAVAARVGSEPFDAAGVAAAMQGMQERLRESAGRFDESLVMALGQLSPAGRAQLAAAMRRGRR